jgi:hypothetical protein
MNYTEHVFGSARPRMLEWAEDVIAKCMKASCRLGAFLTDDSRMVQFGENARHRENNLSRNAK